MYPSIIIIMQWVFWLSIIIASGATIRIAYSFLQAQWDESIDPWKESRTVLKAAVIFILIPAIIALIRKYYSWGDKNGNGRRWNKFIHSS